MTPAEMYADTRERLTALFRTLTPEQLATRASATPAWTVKDIAGHLAGAADDILAGRIEGAATDPWTAKQVEARRDLPIDEVLDEWTEKGAQLTAVFDMAGPAMNALVFDVVTHEQDVRGALGLPGGRDTRAGDWTLQQFVARIDGAVRRAGLPPLRVKAGVDEWILGATEQHASPAATLATEPYELLRGLIGRRSLDQLRSYDWDGDAEPYLPVLTIFPPAATDVIE